MGEDLIQIEKMPYSKARLRMEVGDGIGCQGSGPVSKAILLFNPGRYRMTHWGTIDRDINLSVDGHVKIFEFLGRGPQSNYLSKVYQKIHGRIFWCPMESTPSQKMKIIQEACRLQIEGVKYDFKSTWKAALGKIFLDAEKFNCSEGGWWLWRKAAMVKPLFDEKDPEREIAPVPGDMPYYSGTKRIVELIMG